MPNQYTKISLFIEEDSYYNFYNEILSTNLSFAIIDVLKDILPKDIESIDKLINMINAEI